MKLTTCVVALSLSTFAAAGFFDQQIVLDDKPNVPGDNPLTFCQATDDYLLQIDYVNLSPNPPQAGKTLTIKAAGNFTKQIDYGAYVQLVVKWGYVKLINQKEDLCEQMKDNVDKECPLEKGETTITKEVELPREIPPGDFTVFADVYSVDDERITCLEAKVKF